MPEESSSAPANLKAGVERLGPRGGMRHRGNVGTTSLVCFEILIAAIVIVIVIAMVIAYLAHAERGYLGTKNAGKRTVGTWFLPGLKNMAIRTWGLANSYYQIATRKNTHNMRKPFQIYVLFSLRSTCFADLREMQTIHSELRVVKFRYFRKFTQLFNFAFNYKSPPSQIHDFWVI